MGLPKRKVSRSRRDKRRTHKRLVALNLSICSSCGEKKLPHRVCPHCGMYDQREILPLEEV